MDLFQTQPDSEFNLLPQDGTVQYHGTIFTPKKANHYFELLLTTIDWKQDQAFIFGKQITTQRKVAWYADQPYQYTYSNTTKQALFWTPELLELKTLVETQTKQSYNSCLLNLYHNGNEGMGWHSDAEKALKKNGAIASLSFGAARKFAFKHKATKQTINIILENGSLLVMKNQTQTHWLHRLPPTKRSTKPRINLTFRTIVVSTPHLHP
ncbi:alpha-ketoglutarate-dependent dioxygenase AlkB family protein [Flavobacterium crassostreae]|uniref:DNA methylase n=1 Tax=Flavobacterium crassostreae TaxID=1763534 RepID=A0A1B9E9N9_9FLAO|nr:alpha-ketoglutarate-dependent dioxygenase AlkB [Flavobacterium crassostreae]OCB78598.1 DNA methylase [Flavobacterium crassostreae]